MIALHHLPKASRIAAATRILVFLSLLMILISPSVTYAAFPGTNGNIAFDSDRNGNEDIYVVGPDGLTQLTFDPAPDGYPEWSADGTKIVFQSARDSDFEIYVMNADGSGQMNLTNDPNLDLVPTWSPNGTQIAFTSRRDGNEEIYVMNADGSGQTNLTNHLAGDAQPAWSPDGTQIAFESLRSGPAQVFVMNTDGSGLTQLTSSGSNGGANWSPDGTKIVFHSNRDGNFNIYSMNADGSGQTQLTSDSSHDLGAVWSPDGTKILFETIRDGNSELYFMNPDGTLQTNFTTNPAFDGRADWGPLETLAPLVNISFSSPDGQNGWFVTSPVVGTVEADDTSTGASNITAINCASAAVGSITGLGNPSASASLTVSAEGVNNVNCTATDSAGNSGAANGSNNTATVMLDSVDPNINIVAPANGGSYLLNAAIASNFNCSDMTSGFDSCSGPVANGANFDTNSVGPHTFTVTSSDVAGNSAQAVSSYNVIYNFAGFFQPVDNLPVLNSVKAGQAIPVKFRLGGNQGLNIFEANYPKSQVISCDSTAPVDGIEETVTAGSSSLTYDASTDTYTYVWKTEKSWANTCRQLVVKLNDGTLHRANFKFK